jgi:hypothetical protein
VSRTIEEIVFSAASAICFANDTIAFPRATIERVVRQAIEEAIEAKKEARDE